MSVEFQTTTAKILIKSNSIIVYKSEDNTLYVFPLNSSLQIKFSGIYLEFDSGDHRTQVQVHDSDFNKEKFMNQLYILLDSIDEEI